MGGHMMKLLFKQRLFSWFDSYDIFDENGKTVFTVEGKLNWGHCLHILDATGVHIGTVNQKISALMPRFELSAYGEDLGCIRQEFTLFTPRFVFDCSDWTVEGSWTNWDYSIVSPRQGTVAVICKALFQMTDTYAIEVPDPSNALCVLMSVLAIDASKCH